MTVAKAAKNWGLHESTVRQYIRAGVIPGAYMAKNNGPAKWFIPDDTPSPVEKYKLRNAPSSKERYVMKYCGTLSIKEISKNLGISTAEVRNIFDSLKVAL